MKRDIIKRLLAGARNDKEKIQILEYFKRKEKEIDKNIIKKILRAETLVRNHIYWGGMTPNDYSSMDYVNEVFDVLNKPNYRRMLLKDLKG